MKHSALKRGHPTLQNIFLLLWVIFSLLDPDPLTRMNPDPIGIRIRNPAPNHTPSPVPLSVTHLELDEQRIL
jgi:hypothetical protein